MNINHLQKGVLTVNDKGIGEVSRKMLRERAAELAVINGRAEQDVSKSDWDQAKRELTGEPVAALERHTLEVRDRVCSDKP